MTKQKVLVIVGPTASGKTSLSIRLAQKYGGEIISADSRQVYQGLDIGTGKITHAEMKGIPHHMLDVAPPHTVYTVTDFVEGAHAAIRDITLRKKLPIIVGGTFLYTDTLLGNVSTPPVPPNPALRTQLESKSTEQLFELLKEKDPVRAKTIDPHNPRRLIRALEIIDVLGVVPEPTHTQLYDALTLGITITKEQLQKNIHDRLNTRMQRGMMDEIKQLHTQGVSYTRMSELGIEYQCGAEYLQGNVSLKEMCTLIETKSMQYAKRQMTWLKRKNDIVWINPEDTITIAQQVEQFLSATD